MSTPNPTPEIKVSPDRTLVKSKFRRIAGNKNNLVDTLIGESIEIDKYGRKIRSLRHFKRNENGEFIQQHDASEMIADEFIVRFQDNVDDATVHTESTKNGFIVKRKLLTGEWVLKFDISDPETFRITSQRLSSIDIIKSISYNMLLHSFVSDKTKASPHYNPPQNIEYKFKHRNKQRKNKKYLPLKSHNIESGTNVFYINSNDPGWGVGVYGNNLAQQWALDNKGLNNGLEGFDIRAGDAWSVRTNSANIVVAVVDTGVSVNHEDLNTNIWEAQLTQGISQGYNAILENFDVTDTYGHGSWVAGIIGAEGNNEIGISGVAWDTNIMPIKASNDGSFIVSDAIDGIQWAINNGANIINLGFGGYFVVDMDDQGSITDYTSDLYYGYFPSHDEVNHADSLLDLIQQNPNTLFVAATGNDKYDLDGDIQAWTLGGSSVVHPNGNYMTKLISLPAGFQEANLISVSSSRRDGEFPTLFTGSSKGSNYGINSVDITAPGDQIISTSNIGYVVQSGTSASAPMVSGAAALAWARFPLENATQIRNRLIQTADHIPALSTFVGNGRHLNLAAALSPWVMNSTRLAPTQYYLNSWFGLFEASIYPRIFHQWHGWIWCNPPDTNISNGIWFWDNDSAGNGMGWLFVEDANYPMMFRNTDQKWLYFDEVLSTGPKPGRKIYSWNGFSWDDEGYR